MIRAIDWGRRKRKRDDRMLKDMGLSPEQALGPGPVFWSEWERLREPWLL